MNPASPLSTFWAWWWPSLISWIPKAWQPAILQTRHPVEVIWTDAGADLSDLGDLATADAIILLPREQALVRELRFPASAVKQLRSLARFEVERQTPFAVEQVYFDAILRNPPERLLAHVLVLLVVVPRSVLDPILEAAKASIPRLVGVDVIGADGLAVGANVLPTPLRFRPPQIWRRWNITLSLLCLIACIGTFVGLLNAREDAVAKLQQQAEPILAQASRTKVRDAQLKELQRDASATALAEQHATLEVLSELSRTLPRDSYVIHMRLESGVLGVRGRTKDLGAVLTGLRKSSLWGDPKLTGTRTLDDARDQEFSLELPLRFSTKRVSP